MYAIITDFDGTITTFDMAHRIVEHYSGAPAPNPYADGVKEDGKEWMSRQMKSVKVSQEDFENFVLSTAAPREGLLDLVKACFECNVPIEIVSGGVDLYIKPFLLKQAIAGLPLFCAKGTFTSEGIELDFEDFNGLDLEDFKAAHVIKFKELGYTVIFCGDGHTDIRAAAAADIVFAAGHLLEKCRQQDIPARELLSFKEVENIIRS
ncbi:HAD superfamily phosphoserine phosphatase-like hydrolase [Elusimicrobium simillimum]|uniref:HAD-IB family phosphatase n=1 Tax=Elusimicrobium simillimum TaxID=3143438 RepID=UPI003C6EBA93